MVANGLMRASLSPDASVGHPPVLNCATLSFVSPTGGIPEADVIAGFGRAGITFDPTTRSGVVPPMLSCLAIDGRFGITAVGDSAAHANELQEATISAMHDLAATFG